MATVLDLINSSMRVLGVIASGESLPSNEATDALSTLNDILDSWSTESLIVYGVIEEVFTPVAGQGAYTMGTGGNFNTTRPQKIQNAMVRTTSGSNTVDLPIDILDQDEWTSITVKNVQSSLPRKLFYQDTYPLCIVNFWPVPNDTSRTIVLWSWKPLTSFATTSTTLSLPPGYKDALKYGLALRLAPEYGKALSEEIVELANTAKANIKRMNSAPRYMTTDAVALGSTKKPFNWITGE